MANEKVKQEVIPMEPKNIYQRISAISADVGSVSKDGHNAFSNYDYVRAADVVNKVREACVKHGVVIVPHALSYTRELNQSQEGKTKEIVGINMAYHIVNIDNPEDSLTIPLYGMASDTGDKAIWKAYTGALKYFLTGTFQIGTDDDPENDSKDQKAQAKSSPTPAPKAAVSRPTSSTGEYIYAMPYGTNHLVKGKAKFQKDYQGFTNVWVSNILIPEASAHIVSSPKSIPSEVKGTKVDLYPHPDADEPPPFEDDDINF